MTIRAIVNYLERHGIDFVQMRGMIFARYEWLADGKIYANYVNVSGFSRRELLTWLGY